MDRVCLTGWLLSPSPTDGTNVPFFVNVRDKDIVWDERNLPISLKELSDLGENKKIFYTGSYWKYDYNDWSIELKVDGTYRAKKKINIGESFDDISSNSTTINSNLRLPFNTINDNDFSVSITNISDDTRIKSSINGIKNITTDAFDSIDVYLNNNQYLFSANFKSNSLYTDSFLFINVEGKVSI